MRSTLLVSRLGRALLGAAVLVLPFVHSGCGRTACFQWTAAEGSCPAQAESMKFFADPGCGSAITTIDSEGVFENGLCCYAVTQQDPRRGEEFTCSTPGTGGAPSMTSGKSGMVSVVSVTTGELTCLHCSQVEASLTSDPPGLCSVSAFLLKNLVVCMCVDGPCVAVCQSNICVDDALTDECGTCMQDAQIGCGNELNDCVNDF